jgi:hypothetical protein
MMIHVTGCRNFVLFILNKFRENVSVFGVGAKGFLAYGDV